MNPCSHWQQLQQFLDFFFIYQFSFRQILLYFEYIFATHEFALICLSVPFQCFSSVLRKWPMTTASLPSPFAASVIAHQDKSPCI